MPPKTPALKFSMPDTAWFEGRLGPGIVWRARPWMAVPENQAVSGIENFNAEALP